MDGRRAELQQLCLAIASALTPRRLKVLLTIAGFDVVYQQREPWLCFVPWPALTGARLPPTRPAPLDAQRVSHITLMRSVNPGLDRLAVGEGRWRLKMINSSRKSASPNRPGFPVRFIEGSPLPFPEAPPG